MGLQGVVGIIGSLRVQLNDLQGGWFWGVTGREQLEMASGYWAQTSGRIIELKFPEVVKAGLGTGKRGNFKKAIWRHPGGNLGRKGPVWRYKPERQQVGWG